MPKNTLNSLPKKCETHLENVIPNIIDLQDRRVRIRSAFQHGFKAWRGRHKNNLVCIKYSAFNSELDVRQFRIIYILGINSSPIQDCCIPDFFDCISSVARLENVGQQQSCSFVLKQAKSQPSFSLHNIQRIFFHNFTKVFYAMIVFTLLFLKMENKRGRQSSTKCPWEKSSLGKIWRKSWSNWSTTGSHRRS